jgi:AraC-like DNA-binding protein
MFVLRGREPSWIAPTLNAGFRLISLALVAHALWMVWKGRSTDLVEARGRLRIVLVVCVGLITAAVLLTAYLFGPVADRPISVKLGEAVALLLFALTAGVRLLRFAPEYPRLPDEAATPRPQLPAFIESMAAAPGDFPAEEAASLALLETLMSEGEVWRETGLTIGSLARRVGVPEYRLRRLINQRLGFRNFTSFLNDYRLAAAAERLADGSRVRTPILTIALDLGWGSIGPFNRAFRSRFGISPSDYRRDRTQRPRPPDRAPPPADS